MTPYNFTIYEYQCPFDYFSNSEDLEKVLLASSTIFHQRLLTDHVYILKGDISTMLPRVTQNSGSLFNMNTFKRQQHSKISYVKFVKETTFIVFFTGTKQEICIIKESISNGFLLNNRTTSQDLRNDEENNRQIFPKEELPSFFK